MEATGKDKRVFFVAAVAAVCMAAALLETSFGNIVQDDAYITFRYAGEYMGAVAGVIPYYRGLYTIDMTSLTDTYVVHHGKRTAARTPGGP